MKMIFLYIDKIEDINLCFIFKNFILKLFIMFKVGIVIFFVKFFLFVIFVKVLILILVVGNIVLKNGVMIIDGRCLVIKWVYIFFLDFLV